MERVDPDLARARAAPSEAEALRSGKGHRDENFPVASRLISPKFRAPIMAFYNYVRTADDIADHGALSESEKLRLLDQLEASLLGQSSQEPAAVALRQQLEGHGLGPQHALDLLTAFRRDVTKRRYSDWDDLLDYCRYSAMPVGRFVLDVHGEDRSTWPANDALCAALQINNHLQDCGKDYRELDRVYVPQDALGATGAKTEELGAAAASPNLLRALHGLAERTAALLGQSGSFASQVRDWRLALEISVIDTYARRIVAMLMSRDPLSQNVHLRPAQFAVLGARGVLFEALRRLRRHASMAPSSGR